MRPIVIEPTCSRVDCFANEVDGLGRRVCTALSDNKFRGFKPCPFYKNRRKYREELEQQERKAREALRDLPNPKSRELI